MAATIIYLAISLFVSLIFIVLGIKQYRAEKPIAINTGEKRKYLCRFLQGNSLRFRECD